MKRILVAERDVFFLNVLVDFLKQKGYDVMAVDSGFKAYAHLRSIVFDLALIDIAIPGKSGIEILELLNVDVELFGEERTPVIIMADESDFEAEKKARIHKTSGFILKPFELEDLVVELNRFLGQEEAILFA